MKSKYFAFFVATLLCGVQAHGAITVHDSLASFTAASSNIATDKFDDLSYLGYYQSPLNRAIGNYAYTVSAPDGLFGAGLGNDIWLSSNSGFDDIILTNFTGVSAIGGSFFRTDIDTGGYVAGSITFSITDADGTISYTLANPSRTGFLGFTSTTNISGLSIAIANANGDVFPTLNDLRLGARVAAVTAVPEPTTWAMLLSGMLMLGGLLRRRPAALRRAS